MVGHDIMLLLKTMELYNSKNDHNVCKLKKDIYIDRGSLAQCRWIDNLTVLQILNNLTKLERVKDGNLRNWTWIESARLKAKGIAQKHCPLVDTCLPWSSG